MSNKLYSLLFIIFLISGLSSHTQTIPVGIPIYEDYYRRAQLLGKFDEAVSFASRPIFPASVSGTDIFDPDSTMFLDRVSNFDGLWKFGNGKGLLQLLPISILNQYNSHHPEGISDGAMIPAKGFQTLISAGVYIKLGPLSIQLRPEYIKAQNLEFEGFPQYFTNLDGVVFPESPYGHNMDLLERFGTDSYNKAFWGQSSVRLTIGSLSFGASNENLWWGPGYRNSLLMTNSAPGFMHLSLNTIKPIKTYIGSFEGQIIAGRLEASGYANSLPDDWRYINAMVVTYQPKWIPGLFIGGSRGFLMYNNSLGNRIINYIPIISFLSKSVSGTREELDNRGQDQLISIFMRWLFQEAKGEIYFEYGREDHSWDLRDFVLEPSHSSAFILGLRKLFLLSKQEGSYMQLIIEGSNLAGNQTVINRGAGGTVGLWYQHSAITQGYTNNGQLLGAGIGPGSNLQTLDISWVESIKQVGIQVERYVHNNDFWYDYIKDIRSNWVDISAMAYANWDYKNLLFTIKLKYIKSYNYQWMYEPVYEEAPTFWTPSENTHNFHGQLGVMYRF